MAENIFPYEIQLALRGLNNENRQTILTLLMSGDPYSFTDIVEITKINRSLLANHLNILIESLLVDRFYEHKPSEEKYSFYQITNLGKNIVSSMMGSLFQKTKITLTKTYTEKLEIEASSLYGDVFQKIEDRMYETINSTTNMKEIKTMIPSKVDA